MTYPTKTSFGVSWKRNFLVLLRMFISEACISPPEQSSREKRLRIDHFKQLKETTTKIAAGQKILIGDFNARTQSLKDTLTKEKHDEDIGYDFYSNIETERDNSDKVLNNYTGKNSSNTV